MLLKFLICQAIIISANAENYPSYCGNENLFASATEKKIDVSLPLNDKSEIICNWYITAPPGKKVWLNVARINLTKFGDCQRSRLEINDVTSERIAHKHSTICILNERGKVYISGGYKMYLKLTMRQTFRGRGITVLYKEIDGITPSQHDVDICGDDIIDVSVADSSWKIPIGDKEAFNKQCRWKLIADIGKKVQVTINNITFYSDKDCEYNKLQLFDGINGTSTPIDTICKMSENSSIYTSMKNDMLINFSAWNISAGTGFEAAYTQIDGITAEQHDKDICGNDIINAAVANNTWIVPINGKDAYNKQCLWKLIAEKGHKVQVNFDYITFSSDEDCSTNKLQLYDGTNEISQLIATICETPSDKRDYTSSGNNMFIKFTAFNVEAGQGFKASYKQIKGSNAWKLAFNGKWITVLLLASWLNQY